MGREKKGQLVTGFSIIIGMNTNRGKFFICVSTGFDQCGKDAPHNFVCIWPLTFCFHVELEQLANTSHCHFVVIVGERDERVFEHIGGMAEQNQR